jgi:hypothetical protein
MAIVTGTWTAAIDTHQVVTGIAGEVILSQVVVRITMVPVYSDGNFAAIWAEVTFGAADTRVPTQIVAAMT